MASIYKHKTGAWYAVILLPSKRRAQLYLGRVTKSAAENVGRKLDALLAANRIGEPPPAEVAAWLSILAAQQSPLVDRLAELGALACWRRPTDSPTLADYWGQYLERRRDYSDRSRRNWAVAWNHVSAAFPNATLASIDAAAAEQFGRDLQLTLASTTARPIVGKLKMIYAEALKLGLVRSNPFADCSIVGKADKTLYRYVPEPVALQVLDGFAFLEGRALFALARWCGLRVPSEPLVLQWSNVDWAAERLYVPKAKTEPRFCPLFPVALRELRTLYDSAPDGATWVFNRARGSASTSWRNWIEVACRTAGVKPWPKIWHNLRRSRRTELEKQFPNHVCNAWLGHSDKVAAESYLMLTDEDWNRARNLSGEPAEDPTGARRADRRTAPDTAPSGTDGNPAA